MPVLFDAAMMQMDFRLTIHDFFPLAVGNEWGFEMEGELVYMSVTGTQQIGGNIYYELIPGPFFNWLTANPDMLLVRRNELGDLVMNRNGQDFVLIPFSVTELFTQNLEEPPWPEEARYDRGNLPNPLVSGELFFYQLFGIGGRLGREYPYTVSTPSGAFDDYSAFLLVPNHVRDVGRKMIFAPDAGPVYIEFIRYGDPIVSPLARAEVGETVLDSHRFAVHYASQSAPPGSECNLSELTVSDNNLFSDDDIVSYDWNTHTITFRESSLERLGWYDTLYHRPFVVFADYERIYYGWFMALKDSMGIPYPAMMLVPDISDPVTDVLPNPVRIDRSYPGGGETLPDPRTDPRIETALEKLDKLVR